MAAIVWLAPGDT